MKHASGGLTFVVPGQLSRNTKGQHYGMWMPGTSRSSIRSRWACADEHRPYIVGMTTSLQRTYRYLRLGVVGMVAVTV
ncbi:hypothetical protein [uncultured Microbacterium sp.]|uniref:hypothetical protein n=1 Tax=uncultured Microbacterium sp. TaxID=191216 RepID=UPI00262B9E6F|nr:hypothetical protein [uncultured Microbacterium sp.]